MWLGIDVGGTFTDAVIVHNGKVRYQVKTPTTHDNLLQGILQALDTVLAESTHAQIERISLSTTIVTNALVEGKTDNVGLITIPGPGLDISDKTPVKPYVLSGYIDHRGRQAADIPEPELKDLEEKLSKHAVFAVSGKFSVRNACLELKAKNYITKKLTPYHITLGSELTGTLNFLRRTNTAYFNAAVYKTAQQFIEAMKEALTKRNITAPVYMLKADGGTLPLDAAGNMPVESVFTGPAASVLGIMAMTRFDAPAVSLDIGGTTTDIALWQQGMPLFSERGAAIDKYPTSVKAFRLKSVGIGGDSLVERLNGELKVGSKRLGPAMAVGGTSPTVTDALIAAGLISLGDKRLAVKAMQQITDPNRTYEETAREVLDKAAEIIIAAINTMIGEKLEEPVYRVEDIIHEVQFMPERIVGVGGGALGLVPLVAKKLNLPYEVPQGAMVANAVGAAVAKPTISVTVRIDTEQKRLSVAELSINEPLPYKKFTLGSTRQLAENYLALRAKGVGIDAGQMEEIYAEEFNIVRGFHTVGKIFTSCVQIKPAALAFIGEREKEHE